MAKQNAAEQASTAKSRFQTIATDRPQYKASFEDVNGVEKLNTTSLVGYLITKVVGLPNPTAKPGEKQHWNAYVIKTTEPCIAEGLEDDGPRQYPAGTEVMIGETAKLSRLEELLFADRLVEVSIAPKKKVKLDGGRTMWLYDVGANPETMPRPRTAAMHAGRVAPQLPAAGVNGAAQRTVVEAQEEIPF